MWQNPLRNHRSSAVGLHVPLHRLPALLSAAKEVREQGTFGYIDTSLATPGGRVGIDGSEIETLDEAGAAQAFAEARAAGISACAILLMHAAPFGLAGGADGALGRQWVERRDGSRHVMTGTDRTELAPGDLFVIETPGGGGYGPPSG
jgi:hypothetical protein